MAKFYQVGGSVRDELLGLKSKDIDYAVEADSYDALVAAIEARGGEIFRDGEGVPIGAKYLTVRAKVPVLGLADYVLCRKDGAYYDGRRPDTVEPGTIYDDLARRDFTINAIAKAEDGTWLDPYDGHKDLKDWKLRCVGNAKDRFTEDGLRMLRAIRFSITKYLKIDTDIDLLLKQEGWFGPRLVGVSAERIREELYKCFAFSTPITLRFLQKYSELFFFLLGSGKLWLKPTLEGR